jgi:hypothetical protein
MKNNRLTSKELTDYFAKREETIKQLDEERNNLAQKVLDLIPSELKKYRNERFYNLEATTEFLQVLYDHIDSGWWARDRFKVPEDYGFKNKSDAYKKMQLLRKAWQNIIDIKLDKSDRYLEVHYKLSKKLTK